MRRLIALSLSYRYLLFAFAVGMIILGIVQLPKMPEDVLPEFNPPVVEIQTEAIGLSAEEVESLITLNLEEFLNGVPWLQSITSESIAGLSSIRLTFEPGTDLMRARQVVQESLSLVYTMPNVSKPPLMLQPLSTTRRTMMVGLSSKTLSPIEVSVLAQWTIKPRLLGIPGVANVVIWGKKNRELQVQIDPKRLKEFGLTQDQIIKTAGEALWVSQLSFLEASLPGTGGWIDTPNQRLGIRHISPISTPEDLAKLPIEGTKFRLGEISKVVEGHQPIVGDTYFESDAGVVLVIEKFPDADTVEVTREVKKALEALKLGLPGLDIDPNYFQLFSYIETARKHIGLALLLSAILLALVMFLFLSHWRAALITLILIALTFIISTLILYWYGFSVNIMILAGFAMVLGVVIDDQIMDMTNILASVRKKRQEGSKKLLISDFVESASESKPVLIYGTAILLIAILPIFFMREIIGSFFHPLTIAYILTLVISFIISLSIAPVLTYMLLNEKPTQKQGFSFVQKLMQGYESTMSRLMKKPNLAYLSAAVLVLAALIAWPFFNTDVLPQFKDRELVIELEGSSGMSHIEISRIINRVTQEIRTIPGIKKVIAHSGHAVTGDLVVGIHSGRIWASIDPNANFDKTFHAVKELIHQYHGLDRTVHTYLSNIAEEAFAKDKEAVVIRIYGINRNVLNQKAEEIKQALSNIEHVKNVQVEDQTDEAHVEVRVDMAKAAPYGIKPGDVRRAASTIFAGITVGNLFENQKIFDVVVWGVPKVRKSIRDIQELLIDKPDGGYVRLGDIADVKVVLGPTLIAHESISPYIDVVADLQDGNVGKAMSAIKDSLKKIEFPLEYHPEILGEIREIQNVKRHLLITGFFAIIVIYFLLQACFNSWSLALLGLLVLPFALTGSILFIIFNGGVISFPVMLGFLAVLGINIRQVISLIRYCQDVGDSENANPESNVIIKETGERFYSFLLTPIATIAAFLPFVFFANREGFEVLYPMAIVIIGGLITSTLLILFLMPLLYLLVVRKSHSKKAS